MSKTNTHQIVKSPRPPGKSSWFTVWRTGTIWRLQPGHTMSELGLLPDFLHAEDSRPIREQLTARYAHGGGYMPVGGWSMTSFTKDGETVSRIKYPGDSVLKEIARAAFPLSKGGPETAIFFPYAWLAIVAADGTFSVTRVD